MKKLALAFLLIIATSGFSQEADIKNTVNAFFDAMHKRDTVALSKVCSYKIVLHSVAQTPRGDRFTSENTKDFFKSIATIPAHMKIEEKLLSYDIKIDGPMAHVWTPYEFYIDGKMSHSGVNSFQLVRQEGVWKIAYIIDTRKRGGAK